VGKWDKLKGKYPATPAMNMSAGGDTKFLAKVDFAKVDFAPLTQAELMEKYKTAKAAKEDLESKISQHNVELEALGQLLLKKFEEQDIRSAVCISGHNFYTSVEPYVSYENRDSTGFFEWLDTQPELAHMWTVHNGTLSSYVKNLLEAGLDEQVPPHLSIQLKTQIKMKNP